MFPLSVDKARSEHRGVRGPLSRSASLKPALYLICMRIYTYLYLYIHMYTYIYMYIHTYKHDVRMYVM